MKTTCIYLILFITTVLLFNCKKYPEGECERRGPKNIIGNWKLSLYEVNGIDSTELINHNGDELYKTIRIYKNASTIQIDQKSSITSAASFSDKNKTLTIKRQTEIIGSVCYPDNNINYCYRLFFTPENSHLMDWEVLKITKEEIILSSVKNKSYKIKLVRV
jgi:hypothetical protein